MSTAAADLARAVEAVKRADYGERWTALGSAARSLGSSVMLGALDEEEVKAALLAASEAWGTRGERERLITRSIDRGARRYRRA